MSVWLKMKHSHMAEKTNRSMEISRQREAAEIRLWLEMQVSGAPRQETFPVFKGSMEL